MVPAVALADEAPEVQDDATLELLATSSFADAWAAGEVTAATDQDNKEITATSGVYTFQADGKAHYIVPTEVTPDGMAAVNLEKAEGNITISYAQAVVDETTGAWTAGTNIANATNIKAAGKYVAVVNYNGKSGAETGINANVIGKFEIKAASLEGAYIVEGTAFNAEKLDTEFEYIGAALNYKFGIKNAAGENVELTASDVDVQFKSVVNGVESVIDPATAFKEAGNYKVTLTPKTDTIYAGSDPVTIDVTVNKLTLTDKNVALKSTWDGTSATDNPAAADFELVDEAGTAVTGANISSDITVALTTTPDSTVTKYDKDKKGEYVFTITPTANNKNVTGQAKVTYRNVASDKVIGTASNSGFYYDGEAWATAFASNKYKVDHSLTGDDATPDFDISKAVAYLDDQDKDKKKATAVTPTVKQILDKDGNVVTDQSLLKTPGVWTVTLAAEKNVASGTYAGYWYGETTVEITVTEGDIAISGVQVAYKGTVANKGTKAYDSTDAVKDITVTVRDANKKVLTAGTDYKVKYVVGTSGKSAYNAVKDFKEVTEFVNANASGESYYVIVTSNKYTLASEGVYEFSLTQAKPEKVRLAGLYDADDGTKYYQYTGSDITPVIEYMVTDAEGNAVWSVLPEENYTLTIKKGDSTTTPPSTVVKKINGKGFYSIEIAEKNPAKDDNFDVNTNIVGGSDSLIYSVAKDKVQLDGTDGAATDIGAKTNAAAGKTIYVEVKDGSAYVDVTTKDWFYSEVEKARQLGYMTGVGNKQFDPNGTLSRAQAATVIFKMAGNNLTINQDTTSTEKTYPTEYVDVDDSAWYAQPVQWASKLGIITGWEEDGAKVFDPMAPVTREQFALMMQRYAKSVNKDAAGDASVLSAYKDASAVDSWATDGVSWAVKNKVMGKDTDMLSPTNTIIRAEAAAMTVRYQPEGL